MHIGTIIPKSTAIRSIPDITRSGEIDSTQYNTIHIYSQPKYLFRACKLETAMFLRDQTKENQSRSYVCLPSALRVQKGPILSSVWI